MCILPIEMKEFILTVVAYYVSFLVGILLEEVHRFSTERTPYLLLH